MKLERALAVIFVVVALVLAAPSAARATALQFAGDGDRVDVALPALFDNIATSDFTFTGRVRADGFATSRVLYAQKDTNHFATILMSGTGTLIFYVNSGGTTFSASGTPALTIGQWSHFGARWIAATNSVSLTVDGTTSVLPGGTSSTGTSGAFTLGTRTDGAQPLNGALDELTLWPAALSDTQIAADRSGLCVGGIAPVLRYDFEVGTPNGNNAGLTTLPDISGNAVNGTLNGFALSGTAGNWITSPYAGCSSTDLGITLAAAPDPIAAGDPITWTAHLTNAGPADANGVTVNGEVPVGTSFVALTAPAGFSCTTPAVGASGALSCSIAIVPAGTVDFVLDSQSDPGDAPNSTITANWSVTSLADTNAANDNASASSTIVNAVSIVFDAASTPFEQMLSIDVLANDSVAAGGAPLDPASLSVSVPANHGNASCGASGCSYTPASGYSGVDQFTYHVCDGSATPVCGSADVRVTIAPHAVDDRFVTLQDAPLSATVAGNDAYAPGSTFAKVSGPAAGSVTMAADGGFTYTPNAGYNGGDTFTYTVCLAAPDDAVCDFGSADVSVLQPGDRIFYDGFGF